jgi:hypothetical protein
LTCFGLDATGHQRTLRILGGSNLPCEKEQLTDSNGRRKRTLNTTATFSRGSGVGMRTDLIMAGVTDRAAREPASDTEGECES